MIRSRCPYPSAVLLECVVWMVVKMLRLCVGGFQIVPGFREHLVEWVTARSGDLRAKYAKRQAFCIIGDREPLVRKAIRITARAGSVVLWDQRTPHGSRPNNSAHP